MALETIGAFVVGVAVGWAGRGLSDAPRRELVRSVASGFRVRDAVRRWVAERVEWVEDLIAEGRAGYLASQERAPAASNASPVTDLAEEGFAP